MMEESNGDKLFGQLYDIVNGQKTVSQNDKDNLPENQLKEKLNDIQIKLNQQDVFDREQDREQRRIFADKIFSLLCMYLLVVGLIVIGCGNQNGAFHLSDSVLVVLITTTTANVIGIFILVVKYLFNPRSSDKNIVIKENTIARIVRKFFQDK